MRIVFIGAGRLATHLALALKKAGHDIVQVYSRTMDSAKNLADRVDAVPLTDSSAVLVWADAFIFAVSDSALQDLTEKICKEREDAVMIHTAGSMPMDVFQGKCKHYGVLYPMQTFSKERPVDFAEIHCFVEYNDATSEKAIKKLACSVSNHVHELSTEERRYLHLAAVFACNFANHCYALSAEILEQHGLSFDIMLPLVQETASKVRHLSPKKAQTGPAVRFDVNVINRQMELLGESTTMSEIYKLMSESIHNYSKSSS